MPLGICALAVRCLGLFRKSPPLLTERNSGIVKSLPLEEAPLFLSKNMVSMEPGTPDGWSHPCRPCSRIFMGTYAVRCPPLLHNLPKGGIGVLGSKGGR